MGTNYFLEGDPCPHCGAPGKGRRHVGKSSAGWVFSLHIYPEDGIESLQDWIRLIYQNSPGGPDSAADSPLMDEYGHRVARNQMLNIIMARFALNVERLTPQWLVDNRALTGPLGLARHQLDGKRVLRHGEGTWDELLGADKELGW